MTDNIAYRAARYVSAERDPRQSVSVGPKTVLLLVHNKRAMYALLYSEESGRPDGIHFRLTPTRAERLRDALDGWLGEHAPATGAESFKRNSVKVKQLS